MIQESDIVRLNADNAKRVISCERQLLGGLMHAGADRDGVFGKLHPSDFSTDAHQTVASAIWDLWAERVPLDLSTVADRVSKSGSLHNLAPDENSAFYWLAELYGTAGTSGLVDYHAKEVLDASRIRGLMYVARETIRACLSPTGPADELIDQAAAKVFALSERGNRESRLKTSAQVTNDALDEIDRRQRGEASAGVKTGLIDIDEMTGGLPFGQLTLLAARPSVGKTALALQIAKNAAKNGQRVLFVSLEQRYIELGIRNLASTSRVCGQSLRLGHKLHREEIDRVTDAAGELRDLPFHYDDTPSQSTLQILGTARGLKRTSGLELVVIDYLQLVAPDDPKSSRNDQMDGITMRVRHIARELDCAVLALSQLSRDCEKQNRRPRLSDLRDSGALEQHADAVIMLHRSERSDDMTSYQILEVGIEKQRNGPTGVFDVLYLRKFLRFENAVQEFGR